MGRPKAWLPFGPEVLLQRVVRLVSTVVDPVVVVAAADQNLPPLPPTVIAVRDEIAGRGPLQGLAAGLAALPNEVEYVFATATDAPLLRPAWIPCLHEIGGDYDLIIPSVDGYPHPLAALYRRTAVLPVIKDLLRADRLRLVGLMDAVRTRVVTREELASVDPEFETLRNLNSPDEYIAALRIAGFDTPDDDCARPEFRPEREIGVRAFGTD